MVLGYSLHLTVSTLIKGKKSYNCIQIGQKILVFWYSRANLFIEIAQIFKFVIIFQGLSFYIHFSSIFHPSILYTSQVQILVIDFRSIFVIQKSDQSDHENRWIKYWAEMCIGWKALKNNDKFKNLSNLYK